jgi:hypothetical protein
MPNDTGTTTTPSPYLPRPATYQHPDPLPVTLLRGIRREKQVSACISLLCHLLFVTSIRRGVTIAALPMAPQRAGLWIIYLRVHTSSQPTLYILLALSNT